MIEPPPNISMSGELTTFAETAMTIFKYGIIILAIVVCISLIANLIGKRIKNGDNDENTRN